MKSCPTPLVSRNTRIKTTRRTSHPFCMAIKDRQQVLARRWRTQKLHILLVKLFSGIVTLGKGNGNPLQYSCLENPRNREAWRATVHGVAKTRTRLSDCHSLTQVWEKNVEFRNQHVLFSSLCCIWIHWCIKVESLASPLPCSSKKGQFSSLTGKR